MRSIKRTSQFTIDITEEDGTVNEWVREFVARDDKKSERFDYNKKMKIDGYWYVTTKELEEESDEEE